MGKNKHKKLGIGIWRGTAALAATLLILLGILSLLVRNGQVRPEGIEICMITVCLAAGSACAFWSPRGEGRRISVLLPCLAPALALPVVSMLVSGEREDLVRALIHSVCLLLPSLIRFVMGEKRNGRRGSHGRTGRAVAMRH